MAQDLSGQVILVTGTAGGIGGGIVTELLAGGAKVWATDIRPRPTPFDAPDDRLRAERQWPSDRRADRCAAQQADELAPIWLTESHPILQ